VKDAILTVDKNIRIIETNKQTESICGITSPNIQGKFFSDCFTSCNHACLEVIKEALKKKTHIQDIQIECGQQHLPGQVVLLSCSPLLDHHRDFIGVVLVIRDITRLRDLEEELKEKTHFCNIIGKSKNVQNIFKLIEPLADLDTTVLITGESGTGKELVANALHFSGKRTNRPFIKVNCAALSENLLESELFGHVKGAFTSAIKDKQGRFELARNGTILLDEIGDISTRIQVKLLRILAEKTYERVGDSISKKMDARVIASTNRNLREKVRLGEFREDLFYRLNVIEINIPPLRERIEDIPLLVEHFCKKFEPIYNKRIERISDDVLEIFFNYNWPGNIRELEHTIELAFVLCAGKIIMPEALPPYMINNKKMIDVHNTNTDNKLNRIL
jgi:PAS domain S-box-containing protein